MFTIVTNSLSDVYELLYTERHTNTFKTLHHCMYTKKLINLEGSRGAVAQSVTVKPIGWGFDPTRGDEIFS